MSGGGFGDCGILGGSSVGILACLLATLFVSRVQPLVSELINHGIFGARSDSTDLSLYYTDISPRRGREYLRGRGCEKVKL